MTTYISQGRAVADLRGGDSFNSNFLHRSITNLHHDIVLKIYEEMKNL